MTLKDISNIRQYQKNCVSKNNIDSLVEFLKQREGSVIDVLIDYNQNFKALFYRDNYMHNVYEGYPQLLLVDAKYKLLDLQLPVYLLLVIDSNSLSEIAGLFIVAEETKVLIEEVVTVFKKHNPNWSSTRVIMSDKDFNEREPFSNCFPIASLVICLFHALRSFRREMTCEKMGITSAERSRCLEIIQQISYARSENEYQFHVQKLKATKLNSVVDFFRENWDTIKNQWVCCFKDLNLNLGENTNNRLESTFNKIKDVCSRYSSLIQFFNEFISVLSVLRNERKHSKMMSILRKGVGYQNMDEWEGCHRNYSMTTLRSMYFQKYKNK